MTAQDSLFTGSNAAADPEVRRLTQYFAGRAPGSDVWLSDFNRASSGFSNETRFFTLNVREASGEIRRQSLVARWAPTGANRQFAHYDISYQYRAMQALAKVGIPVPEMVVLEMDATIVGGPFFVMRKVEGEIISDYPPGAHGAGYWFESDEAGRAEIWWNAVDVMARVNRLDWRQPDFDFLDRPSDGADAIRKRLAFMREQAQAVSREPVPLFERALTWLAANIPSHSKLALCWSDPRPGNIVWKDHQVAAACDWESMNVAPPENDMAWFLLVDEVAYNTFRQPRLAGLPTVAETIDRYEQLIGRKVESFGYYLVFQAALLSILMALSVNAAAAKGIQMPADYATNNYSTQRLAQLLDQAA